MTAIHQQHVIPIAALTRRARIPGRRDTLECFARWRRRERSSVPRRQTATGRRRQLNWLVRGGGGITFPSFLIYRGVGDYYFITTSNRRQPHSSAINDTVCATQSADDRRSICGSKKQIS